MEKEEKKDGKRENPWNCKLVSLISVPGNRSLQKQFSGTQMTKKLTVKSQHEFTEG